MTKTNPAFTLLWKKEIPELNTTALMFQHNKTKAEVLILEADNDNKVFGIGFRTIPTDSTGVAHILEHAVLNGSHKYPVKDAFVELLKSSLYTYLNASTYPDKTIYPIASQNIADFYNLADVYTNAVFFPLLDEKVFKQEGWHYEVDEEGKLQYKGVVFNEMKGVLSDPDALLFDEMLYKLSPDNMYGHNSGGDPVNIPDLTYEQFKNFHAQYYHPSNSRVFFYGNGDTAEHLKFIQQYLDKFEYQEIEADLSDQTPFSAPRSATVSYPVGTEDADKPQHIYSMSWLMHEAIDPVDKLAWIILDYLLLQSDAGTLKNKLIESGLGESPITFGVVTELKQLMFSTGLKNIREADVPKVEKLVMETFAELGEGIDPEQLTAAINKVEFALRESEGRSPLGLKLFTKSLQGWLYGSDPIEEIAFADKVAAIRSKVEKGEKYFEELIKRDLLDNKHLLKLQLQPDSQLNSKREQAERKRLDDIQTKLSDEELNQIKADMEVLQEWQKTPDSSENLAKLPKLKVSDLEKEIKKIPQQIEKLGDKVLLSEGINTNGIIYLQLGFDISTVPQGLLPYIELLTDALFRLGTKDLSYTKLANITDTYLGGLSIGTYFAVSVDPESQVERLMVETKVLAANFDKVSEILNIFIQQINLDQQDKFKQIVLEQKANIESDIPGNGSEYGLSRVAAQLHPVYAKEEIVDGITYLQFLRRLSKSLDTDWKQELQNIQAAYAYMFSPQNLVVNLSVEETNISQLTPKVKEFITALPTPALPKVNVEIGSELHLHEAFILPTDINFVEQAFDLSDEYKIHGSFMAIVGMLSRDYCWNKIRVLGGAYGGSALFDSRAGILQFMSYRDPNVLNTLNTYDSVAEYLKDTNFEPKLEDAIISAVGKLDRYLSPAAKSMQAFAWYLIGLTEEIRQKQRDELLNMTVEQFREFGNSIAKAIKKPSPVSIFGNRAKVSEVKQKYSDLKITELL